MKSVIGKLSERIVFEGRNSFRDAYGGFDDVWYPILGGINSTLASGSSTTNVRIVNHGLVTGDTFVNVTRKSVRTITKVDADNFTVASISGQVAGDVCSLNAIIKSTVWCSMASRMSSYVDENSQRKVVTKVIMVLRNRSDISVAMRVRRGTVAYEILNKLDVDSSGKFLTLEVRELVK